MTSLGRLSTLLILTCATSSVAVAQWNDSGPHMWTADRVGVGGVAPPDTRMYVYDNSFSPVLRVESGLAGWAAIAIEGTTSAGTAVNGRALAPGGVGVFGELEGTSGTAVLGLAHANSGSTYAVRGETNSPDGFSGKFSGGKFLVSGSFTGINRSAAVNTTEAFGIHKVTEGWGGMYISTNYGRPYYGYAGYGWTGGPKALAYHYFDSGADQWRLNISGERLAVGKNGRVGIGTTNPGFMLHVNGTAGKPGGGSWSTASDARLKQNVDDLDGALDKMLALRGVTFEYRDPEAIHELPGERIGVIAQEIERVFPDWVDEHEDGFKRVTFRGFEAVTVEAIRELEERHREETGRLEREVDDLRARLAAIEEALATSRE